MRTFGIIVVTFLVTVLLFLLGPISVIDQALKELKHTEGSVVRTRSASVEDLNAKLAALVAKVDTLEKEKDKLEGDAGKLKASYANEQIKRREDLAKSQAALLKREELAGAAAKSHQEALAAKQDEIEGLTMTLASVRKEIEQTNVLEEQLQRENANLTAQVASWKAKVQTRRCASARRRLVHPIRLREYVQRVRAERITRGVRLPCYFFGRW